MTDLGAVIHVAGCDVAVNDRQRQRCSWCGALLIDRADTGADGWPPGSLVAVAGPLAWPVPMPDGGMLPAESCGQVDFEVTR